ILNTADGSLLRTLVGFTKPIMSVAYSVMNGLIAATSEDTLIHIWNMNSNIDDKLTEDTPALTLIGDNSGSVSCCSFNTEGSRLVTGTRDAMLIVWDVSYSNIQGKTELKPLKTLHACHQDWINDCAWSDLGDIV
uniref:Telomerase protein component 1-like n=1 Tax=Saccoglossus kowalevskii TaxID=10224 RepID=A0ABM0M3P9_SACKO